MFIKEYTDTGIVNGILTKEGFYSHEEFKHSQPIKGIPVNGSSGDVDQCECNYHYEYVLNKKF